MLYKNLADKKFKRLFVFGCSFTQYFWPTWANILSKHYEDADFFNLGKSGAGNHFISLRVAEANERWHFNSDDLVAIMWTSFTREDRFINERWETHGSVYWNNFYSDDFRKNYVDYVGCILRDLGCISLTKGLLQSTGCSMINLSATPISFVESDRIQIPKEHETKLNQILELYGHHFREMPPSVYEWLGNKWEPHHSYYAAQWNEIHKDPHPTPNIYLNYIQEHVMPVSLNAIKYTTEVHNKTINFTDKKDITDYFHMAHTDSRMF